MLHKADAVFAMSLLSRIMHLRMVAAVVSCCEDTDDALQLIRLLLGMSC